MNVRSLLKLLVIGFATLCLLSPPLQGQSADDDLNREHYRKVEEILSAVDADDDHAVGKAELQEGETVVRDRHGAGGLRIFKRYVTAADADGDGTITEAEWRALGGLIAANEDLLRDTVMLPMTDGVELATDVYRPLDEEPVPVILMRTPYNRKNHVPSGLVKRGYAVVIQDMRGRFDSSGENLPFIGCGWASHQDGVETCQWLRRQPWCNGDIGTLGGSAGGITQNLLAGAAPEGLRCQVIHVAAASLYHHAAYVGGALRLSQVERWLQGNEFSPKAFELYRAHHCYDSFWQDFDSTRRHEEMNVPAMHVGGWFDTFALGTTTSFEGRQKHGAEGAKGMQVLVMGPWAHGGFRDGGKVGELVFPNARQPRAYDAQRWFDHWLRDRQNGIETLNPVAYYVMGDVEDPDAPGNEWRFADEWPIPSHKTALYLRADNTLSRTRPHPGDEKNAVTYRFDPEQPCPTRGGCNLTIPAGPADQRPVEERADVMTFTTEPLTEPLEITGRVRADIALSSSAVDTDLSVRLCDVYPDGRSFLMAEGMQRVRFREGLDREVLLDPGTIYDIAVNLWPTSLILNEGHRLRITITSSNYPRFDVNPGTGKPWRDGHPKRKQINTIHCSNTHPSKVVLPTP